jgi:hypothetical protein
MKKWGEIRQRGKKAYVWKTWVICWGLGTAVVSSLIMNFLQPPGADRLLTLIGFTIFPLTGLLAGSVMWALNEKKYADQFQHENS